ncbi:MAG: hypothetical protein D8M59_13570 [Planctomycetes bacterium]|nr:hypothetical protein [Planctomycetota bacterium]NOG53761.1 hypothetical protein [Planctomycetota bacterium]
MSIPTRRFYTTSLFLLPAVALPVFVTSSVPTTALAAPAPQVQTSRDSQEAQWLEDFIHYVLIARLDLAHGSAQALLDSEINDADLYTLVEDRDLDDRLSNALSRALRMPEVEDVAGELQIRLRKGRIDLARDPDEIEKHINNLVGSARAQLLAQEALRSAGEYAVPQLLEQIAGTAKRSMKSACVSMLTSIGRQSVTPLCTALPNLDSVTQETVCKILSDIGYSHAMPSLLELALNERKDQQVRDAAMSAYSKLGGTPNATTTELWLALGERYWSEAESLIAWPSEATNNIWMSSRSGDLLPQPVPTDVFSEVMAMRCAENVLTATSDNASALSLWVASNFRRADQLLDGVDATYGTDMREPMFYAVNTGPGIAQRVLGRAVGDLNAPLARHAIASLNSTAGGANLWLSGDEPSPLVAALDFPDRRVRYDAALALGAALPANRFAGGDRVVPLLGSCISVGAERFAAVIADDDEDRRALAQSLRVRGFTVLPPRASFEELRQDLTSAAGVDLFLLKIRRNELQATTNGIRNHPLVAASPILVLTSIAEVEGIRADYEDDAAVSVARSGVNDSQLAAAEDSVIRRTLGELLSDDEAEQYAGRALSVLRDIAVKNSRAFDIARAEGPLVGALDRFSGNLRLTAAETLSWINTPGAQQALMDVALYETDEELIQIAFLGLVSDSARRFGAFVSQSQAADLLDLVRTSDGILGTASARAHGALNLPPSNTVPLIFEHRGLDGNTGGSNTQTSRLDGNQDASG